MISNNSIAPEMLAAIAAAVYMVLGAKARVSGVEPARPAPDFDLHMHPWSLEGRRQIHHARKVR